MRHSAWIFIAFAILISAVTLLFFGLTALNMGVKPKAVETPAPPKQDAPFVTWLDPSLGPADAKNTIVEYASYACQYCQSVDKDLKKLLANYPNVRLVWKDLPNSNFVGSDLAAEAAQCAKSQGKFWEFHDRLFTNPNATNSVQLAMIAQDLGLDTASFNACVQTREMKPFVERTVNEAVALGIDSEPYFFINGQRHSGALSYEQLEATVRN